MKNMDNAKIEAEIAKLMAETVKLGAETSKLNAEAGKFRREQYWYPAIAMASALGAGLALAKFLLS